MTTMTLSLLDALERSSMVADGEREDDVPARPAILRGDVGDHDVPDGSGPTLDEVVSRVWEGLLADHTAPCPVCAGTLAPRYGAGPGPVAARCTDCGSELS